MKVLVIYDSAFGNTEKIARAIGGAFSPEDKTEVIHPGEIKPEQIKEADLIIVGSPTQGFRPLVSVKDLLESLPNDSLKGVNAAVFDTRMDVKEINAGLRFMVKIGGFAAKRMADAIKKKGGNLVVPPEGFIVNDQKGPLRDGELERAAQWAKVIRETAKARKLL